MQGQVISELTEQGLNRIYCVATVSFLLNHCEYSNNSASWFLERRFCVFRNSFLKTFLEMTDLEAGIDGVERPRPSGGDCSLSAPALTRQRADGLNPGSSGGMTFGNRSPVTATIFFIFCAIKLPAPAPSPRLLNLLSCMQCI